MDSVPPSSNVGDPLEFHVRPDLREAALLLAFEGWNDAGEAASSAVRFIERSIRAVPLAEIDCEEFLDFTVARPTVRLEGGESRLIEWPHTRFAYGAVDPSRELVVGCGSGAARALARLRGRLRAAGPRRFGLRRAVLLGAYLADVLYSRPIGGNRLREPARATRSARCDEIQLPGAHGHRGGARRGRSAARAWRW